MCLQTSVPSSRESDPLASSSSQALGFLFHCSRCLTTKTLLTFGLRFSPHRCKQSLAKLQTKPARPGISPRAVSPAVRRAPALTQSQHIWVRTCSLSGISIYVTCRATESITDCLSPAIAFAAEKSKGNYNGHLS